jgi:hypothetical protein
MRFILNSSKKKVDRVSLFSIANKNTFYQEKRTINIIKMKFKKKLNMFTFRDYMLFRNQILKKFIQINTKNIF